MNRERTLGGEQGGNGFDDVITMSYRSELYASKTTRKGERLREEGKKGEREKS